MKPFLLSEREALEASLPGLDTALQAHPLSVLESPNSPAIHLFRTHKGPGMLVPRELGGVSRGAVHAVRLQRALAVRSPSLGVAATMHNFCVATLLESGVLGDMGFFFLRSIACSNLLIASGNAEGRPGQNILNPLMTARPVEGGYRVCGSKKPCTMTHSMDYLTATVVVEGHPTRRAVVMLPASSEGILRKPFWDSPILAGAESHEVVLEDAFVPNEFLSFAADENALNKTEIAGYIWFNLLVSSTYIGVASALVERALLADCGTSDERHTMAQELESAMSAVEGVAAQLQYEGISNHCLARSLFVRFSSQDAIARAAAVATEILGGMRFIGDHSVSYLHSASRALAFHPPTRAQARPALGRYLVDGHLSLTQ